MCRLLGVWGTDGSGAYAVREPPACACIGIYHGRKEVGREKVGESLSGIVCAVHLCRVKLGCFGIFRLPQ